ncbi:MAG: dTDP-4-dehydrorhamnose reductase [Proteobacteria bacterium]|nr:dTDP-4-dehydrorhamnose reductase [Pseudomonadota bacterium]
MRILVFGKNGQVGSALMALLGEQHEVRGLDQEDMDLVQSSQIESTIRDYQPDWVINASAYTAVDRAETEVELADAINHLAPAAMAKTCAALNCGFLHYSTDYVFDGSAERPYLESDEPNPQSVYGSTKLAGEQAVMAECPNTIILRTAWVYAEQGANFVNTMLRLADERDELGVVSDQFGSPTLAYDLARVSVSVIESTQIENLANVAGIYHATGSGMTSWFGFAREIFSLADKSVKLNAINTEDYPTPAPRPHYSVLSNEKLQRVFGVALPAWQESLAKTLKK